MAVGEAPGWGVKLQTEVKNLQDAFATHVKENRGTHEKLFDRTERPSWAVTWVLTVMGGLVCGLAVWAATHA